MKAFNEDKKICIISLWFSPGHLDHIDALCRMFCDLGHEAFAYLDPAYREFVSDDIKVIYSDSNELPKADLFLVWNVSPKDWRLVANQKKAHPLSKWVFTCHEPYLGLVETIRSFAPFYRNCPLILKVYIRHHVFTKPLLTASDMIMLASDVALERIGSSDPRLVSKCVVLPLPFTDHYSNNDGSTKRDCFSFIATAAPDKAFDKFLGFVTFAAKRDLSMRFQIVTRSKIRKMLTPELLDLEAEGRLLVMEGRDLKGSEIDAAFARSDCSWFAYNASTQSGAVCKALMFGSPVIYTNVGSFADFLDPSCGICINSNSDELEIYEAYQTIRGEAEYFHHGARRCYLRQFDTSHLAPLYEKYMLSRLFG